MEEIRQGLAPLLEYPRGSPKAMKRKFWVTLLGSLGTAAVGTGAFGYFMTNHRMIGVVGGPLMGATRSTRLVWEERQAEIEQAIAAQGPADRIPDEHHGS